jgi:hypothetical protein
VTTQDHYGIVAADLRALPVSQEVWSSAARYRELEASRGSPRRPFALVH